VQEVSAFAIVALGGVRQIAKVLSLEIGVDQPAKRSGLGGLRLPRLGNGRDAGAFREKLSRSQRGLFQVDLVARGAMKAARFPVPIIENLKALYPDPRRYSLPRMASCVAISAPSFIASIHLSRSRLSQKIVPGRVSTGWTGHVPLKCLTRRAV